MPGVERSREPDRGVATVFSAIAVAGLLVVAGTLFWLGAAMVTRHRVSNAADLAALSAAAYVSQGEEVACAKARWVAERMGARLQACRLRGWDVRVRVELLPGGFLGQFGTAHAKARAGPVNTSVRHAGGAEHTTSGTSGG